MPRYAGFAFAKFYPFGGFKDFIGAFDTIEAAKAAVDEHHKTRDTDSPEGHICDLQTAMIVCSLDDDGWQDEQPNAL